MSLIITTYLEMRSSADLITAPVPPGLDIRECGEKRFAFNRAMYYAVGTKWGWTDKYNWSDQQWKAYAESERLRTWQAHYRGALAGYYELQLSGTDVEIAYFGLNHPFIGRGLGGALLSHAIQSAWKWSGTRRVWVHTCTLDHPNALSNYLARGLRIYRTRREERG